MLIYYWRWPTDLAVPGSSPDLFSRKRGSLAHSVSLSSAHHPDINTVEQDVKSRVIHPFIDSGRKYIFHRSIISL